MSALRTEPFAGTTALRSAVFPRSLRATHAGLGAVLLIYLLSGVSGLVYQVLWQRMLALTFGVSAYATATVLAAFMAGLALGGYLAGRVADRVARPLVWYGVVEVLIGVTGLLTPWAFTALQGLYPGVYAALGGSGVAPVARFALAFGVLLVPTALMGASFPLIVKAALGARDDGGRAIGLLYAVNTLGAVVGTLAAGFVLVGQLGITMSVATSAALNVAAGLVAVAIGQRSASEPRAADAYVARPSAGQPSAEQPFVGRRTVERRSDDRLSGQRRAAGASDAPARVACPPRLVALLPWLMAISGFCSLAYEVVWTRLLVLFLETTTYAFTVMLAAFLLGIAVGSALVAPFLRRARNGPLLLAGLQALVAVSSLAALQVIARMDGLLAVLGANAGEGPSLAAIAALSFTAMFPPALFLGMSFPLAVTLFTIGGDEDGGARVGRRLGSLYAANVFGAIFGALAAGFFLVPALGTQATLIALAALNWLAGGLVLAADSATRRSPRLAVGGMTLALVGGLGLLTPAAYTGLLTGRFPGERIAWSEEGIETTVTVTQTGRGRDQNLSMYLNHHHQANDADWMVFFHRMLGHIPMLVHPDPRHVLVVGLGGGATAGATSRYENAAITVVELSRSVVRGAEWFRDVNYAVHEQPNVHMIVDDGRNFLLVGARQWDVITADAIWPTHAGSTNLYSLEYYRLARRSLNEGGVMLQWVNRDLPEEQHKLLMRTFLAAFPHVSLWFDGSLLVGSERPIDPSMPWADRKLDWPISKAALQQVNIRYPEDIRKLYLADRSEIERYVGAGPIITDDQPRLEYFLGLGSNSGPRPIPNRGLRE